MQAVNHASNLAAARARNLPTQADKQEKRSRAPKQSKAQVLEAALLKHMNKRAMKRAKKGGSSAGHTLNGTHSVGSAQMNAAPRALDVLRLGKKK